MTKQMDCGQIILKQVRVHNLKSVDLTLEKNQLIVFSGISGSGKSSMAFDTIYMEGQRRYVESLSTFARRQFGDLIKPDLEHASGISPTISIEQKTAGKNPRSTVGTLTEVYDYLRVLFARVGTPHCPISQEPLTPQSRERIIKSVQSLPVGTKIFILAPYAKGKKAEFREDFQDLQRKGFMRVRVDGKIVNLSDEVALDGNVAHDIEVVIDRLVIDASSHSRLADSVTQALQLGEGICIVVNAVSAEEQLFSTHAFSPKSGLYYASLEPQDFSFNSPAGMCLRCLGLGTTYEFDLEKVIDPKLSIAQDCCQIASSYQTVRYGNIYDNLAEQYGFDVQTPWEKLSSKAKKIFLSGTDKKWTRMHFTHPVTGAHWTDHIQWKGVLYEATSRYTEAKSDSYRKKMQQLMCIQTCPECLGEKLKAYPAATTLGGRRIGELTTFTVAKCQEFFHQLLLTPQELVIAEELLKEIRQRLQFLMEVGLHYLTLNRTAPTLSGGEAQRVRLASQIGCGLVGITYVLDEPSIGLHPRDNRRLIDTLKHLRDMGNTVIVVEHDEETIAEADQVVDFGPLAGVKGGEILAQGTVQQLLDNRQSLTGGYLSGRLTIPIPKKRRKKTKAHLIIEGASHHNLKNINVKIPLGLFVGITGVSGSGKSSLISEILYPALSNLFHKAEHVVGKHRALKGTQEIDKVIAIDQSPIGRTPRSNPATYIKIFDEIRDLFCQLPESKARGYKPGRFSFNVKEGSCSRCEGMGQIKIDMDFMEESWMDCPLCNTRRFDEETLSVLFKGKNIYDVLEMEVAEASQFFAEIPSLHRKLETLKSVGMDYIKLGQSSTTLSGGEAQRVKLAKELVRPSTGKTLYILDEPTTGLHFHDIAQLLKVLHALVDKGNSIVVIEHNMDVIKTVDWIIDIGPEGGEGGGNVVASAPPEKIAKLDSPTGKALQPLLTLSPEERLPATIKNHRNIEKKLKKPPIDAITFLDAEQNNLKQVSATIPRNQITVCTGPSGSGKSSLAFETIYAEGQRRYIESLSSYARQFVKQMAKPKVGQINGLSPAIAIEQKAHAGNPRSTVGTMTEVYDFLRILFARIGVAHCPETGEIISAISKENVVKRLLSLPKGEKLQILAPLELNKGESFSNLIARLRRQGFLRIRLNKEFFSLDQTDEFNFDKKRKNELFLVIDRLKVDPISKLRLYEAIEVGAKIGNGKIVVLHEEKELLFNLSFAVESTGKSYPEITPHTFAFNTAEGMCMDCMGLGYQYGANLSQKAEILSQSLYGLLRYLWQEHFSSAAFTMAETFCHAEGIDPYVPLKSLNSKQMRLIMQGSGEEKWYSAKNGLSFRWIGINEVLAKMGKSAHGFLKETIVPLLNEQPCLGCQGARINPLARNVTIQAVAIHELCQMPIAKALEFIGQIKMSKEEQKLLEEVKAQLFNRLHFLCEVGLQYLSLERRAPTLSGGEAQRIRLARQLGSGLTGALYVLDEPTIGLHPHDNMRLNQALIKLKELDNTLILVEHDPLTIKIADYILDFGPQSGSQGGHIVARGTYQQILENPDSLTGRYLSGKEKVFAPAKKKRKKEGKFFIKQASKHNLKNISVEFPTGAITCLTGVSGSGKSTLMNKILLPALEKALPLKQDSCLVDGAEVTGLANFDKFISIDQNPIGHTVRSDVGTYTDVLTKLREFFAMLPEARAKGMQPRNFSCNQRKGMCTACWGMGYKKIEMHFLAPVKVQCEECQGMRLNPVSLSIKYKGMHFGDYLKMTVKEAQQIFSEHPRILKILNTLSEVGLGYVKLGQETVTLSGGEAQRLKLSRELAKRSTGKTIYLLDEPTTGLHADDIQKLLSVLQKLVDKGNTMVIIEHQQEMIQHADFIIDLGPEAGEKGGHIIAQGTPAEIAANKGSITGHYLLDNLKNI